MRRSPRLAGLIAAVEALRIGRKFGLDPELMTDILNVSSGKNNTTDNKVEQFMLNGAFNSGFALGLMRKDLDTALAFIEAVGTPGGFATACAHSSLTRYHSECIVCWVMSSSASSRQVRSAR